jgi:hypothetical protein
LASANGSGSDQITSFTVDHATMSRPSMMNAAQSRPAESRAIDTASAPGSLSVTGKFGSRLNRPAASRLNRVTRTPSTRDRPGTTLAM